MSIKTQESIKFFHSNGNGSNEKESNINSQLQDNIGYEKRKFKDIKNGAKVYLFTFVLPILLLIGVFNMLTEYKEEKLSSHPINVTKLDEEHAPSPNVFTSELDIINLKLGNTGGFINKRIDTNLDTSKTPGDLAQENAIKKIKELSGFVETYAPVILNQ